MYGFICDPRILYSADYNAYKDTKIQFNFAMLRFSLFISKYDMFLSACILPFE